MNKIFSNKLFVGIFWISAVLLLTLSFYSNFLGAAPSDFFDNWQLDSESVVSNRITYDLLGLSGAPLGLIWSVGELDGRNFIPYESMIGGYAFIQSWLVRSTFLDSLNWLHLLNSFLFATSAVVFTYALRKITSIGFSIVWLFSVAISPWLVTAARNIYWAPWLWLVPAIAAIFFSLAIKPQHKILGIISVYISFVIKFWATGYEVFTSLAIFAASAPLLFLVFNSTDKQIKLQKIKESIYILCASALAFFTVILIQAQLMTGDLGSGLKKIWVDSVLRRTYGNPKDFDEKYAYSLNGSVEETFHRYLSSDWTTDVVRFSPGGYLNFNIPGKSFIFMIMLAAAITIFSLFLNVSLFTRFFALLSIGFLIPASWFIAAKAHAFGHTHILFFLWYLLFVSALLYIPLRFVWYLSETRRSSKSQTTY